MDKMIKITNFMHKISFAAVNNTTKPKRRIVMKKVLALVLSLVLILGGSAAALAETAQSIPPLVQSQFRHVYLAQRCIDAGCGEEGDLLYRNWNFKSKFNICIDFSNHTNKR